MGIRCIKNIGVKGGDRKEMNWNDEREYERLILYMLGFNDGEIGVLSESVVGKSNVCSWRGRRGLLRNHGLDDRKWYPINNPRGKVLGSRPVRSISKEREELLSRLYGEGLNDVEIGEKVDRVKSSIRGWRLRKGLPANAIQGSRPGKRGRYTKAKKEQTAKEPKEELEKGETAKERKLSARRLAEESERAIVDSLPSKEEVYQKVRNSPDGKITTKQLIQEEYGDVGDERRDTVHKLRELDREGLIELDTDSEKGKIIWRA